MTDTITPPATRVEPQSDADEETPVIVSAGPLPPLAESQSIPVGEIVRRGLQIFALTAVAFVVWALVLSGFEQARIQIGMQRHFRAELASNSAPVGGAIPAGAPVAIMQIGAIGVDEVVVEGSRSSQLRKGPGHVVGTPLPGQPGNAVIAGRRTLYGRPFARLSSLAAGDRIQVTTGEGNAVYRVTSVEKLGVHDGSFVQDHGDNRLTLFTADSRWDPSGRLVATAELVGKPMPATVTQHALDADGLGLTGERDAAPYMLVWLQLLAVTGLAIAWAASRWSRSRVWLVFAPALALVMWLFFESFVRLLPSTL